MGLESLICLADQLAVEPVLADARFVPGNEQYGLRFQSKAKATLHYPPPS